jgi:hypothetical protein
MRKIINNHKIVFITGGGSHQEERRLDRGGRKEKN